MSIFLLLLEKDAYDHFLDPRLYTVFFSICIGNSIHARAYFSSLHGHVTSEIIIIVTLFTVL